MVLFLIILDMFKYAYVNIYSMLAYYLWYQFICKEL